MRSRGNGLWLGWSGLILALVLIAGGGRAENPTGSAAEPGLVPAGSAEAVAGSATLRDALAADVSSEAGADPVVDYEAAARKKEEAFKDRLKKDPRDFEAAYGLGNLYYDLGKRDEAEASYRKALEIKPDHLAALVNLGVVLNEGNKSASALEMFDAALKIAPNDILALCNKGQALYALKRYDEAVDLYQKAITIDSKSQMAHYWLGVAFADAGIYREAMREWELAMAADSTSETAMTARDGINVLKQMVGER